MVRVSSSTDGRGFRPARSIIAIMRPIEADAWLVKSHTTPAQATPTMIMTIPI
jgi:hypothetical protein